MITGGRDFNYRIPPPWSPEYAQQYSFRSYMTDLSLWIMLTDLAPHQQVSAIILRLGGAARDIARTMQPQEIINGGMRDGQMLDPVSYLVGALHARFAVLEEESRLQCMTEMLAFRRRGGENIDSLLTRYDTVKQRAAIEGQFVMSVEGCSLQILRACSISPQQLFILLQPFGGQLPQNDDQYNQLCTQIRRYGHISERTQGNVATLLQGDNHQARPGQYFGRELQNSINSAFEKSADKSETCAGFMTHTSPEFGSNFFGDVQGHYDTYQTLSNVQPAYPGTVASYPQPWEQMQMFQTDGWHGDGSHSAEHHHETPFGAGSPWSEANITHSAYPGFDDDADYDLESSSCTSSDDGQEEIDMPDTGNLPHPDASQHVYMMYRRAKRQWRRYTGRPTRRFRRFFKGHIKKKYPQRRSKGRGKGKGSGMFFTKDDVYAYLKGKGKHVKAHTSGKGHGRSQNPKDKDGNLMTCRRCGSTEHFEKNCHQGKGGGHHYNTGNINLSDAFMTGVSYRVGDGRGSHSADPPTFAGASSSSTADVPPPPPPWTIEELLEDPPAPRVLAGPVMSAPEERHDGMFTAVNFMMNTNVPPTDQNITTLGSTHVDPFQVRDPWTGLPAAPPKAAPPGLSTGSLLERTRAPEPVSQSPRGTRVGDAFSRAWANLWSSPQSTTNQAAYPDWSAPGLPVPQGSPYPFVPGGYFDPTTSRPPVVSSDEHRARTMPIAPPTQPQLENHLAAGPEVRVDAHDELASSHSQDQLPTAPQVFNVAKASTLAPLGRRSEPLVNDVELKNILMSQNLTAGLREPPAKALTPPAMLHHQMPLNSTFVQGAKPTPHGRSMRKAPPPLAKQSLDQLQQAIRMTTALRQQSRSQHHQQDTTPQVSSPSFMQPHETPVSGSPVLSDAADSSAPVQEPTPQPAPAPEPVPTYYDGAENVCSICSEDFRHGERVCRLRCRHMFHCQCWDLLQTTRRRPEEYCCPNCRGGPTLTAVWNFIGEQPLTQDVGGTPAENLLGQPHNSPRGSERSFERVPTPQPTPLEEDGSRLAEVPLPSAPTQDRSQEGQPREDGTVEVPYFPAIECFHANTRLADGRLGVLVDPGSVWDLAGDKWAKEAARCAVKHERNPRCELRKEPLNVSGVGNGSQACAYDSHLPISMRTTTGQLKQGEMHTPTIPDSELPGLLGLAALKANRAVIDCHTNKIYFLGPGDYDLEKAMPCGTDIYQAEIAPSGHMILPCGEYDAHNTKVPQTLTLSSRETPRPQSAFQPPTRPPSLPSTALNQWGPTSSPPTHSAL